MGNLLTYYTLAKFEIIYGRHQDSFNKCDVVISLHYVFNNWRSNFAVVQVLQITNCCVVLEMITRNSVWYSVMIHTVDVPILINFCHCTYFLKHVIVVYYIFTTSRKMLFSRMKISIWSLRNINFTWSQRKRYIIDRRSCCIMSWKKIIKFGLLPLTIIVGVLN
jgi:hypothetical protein